MGPYIHHQHVRVCMGVNMLVCVCLFVCVFNLLTILQCILLFDLLEFKCNYHLLHYAAADVTILYKRHYRISFYCKFVAFYV